MDPTKNKSILEITVFFVSLLVLLSLLGYLTLQIIKDEDDDLAANLEMKILPQHSSNHCAFNITVKNSGGTTAAAVNITFALYEGGKQVSDATATIDYVPMHSEKNLRIVFYDTKKDCDSLKVTSFTYVEP